MRKYSQVKLWMTRMRRPLPGDIQRVFKTLLRGAFPSGYIRGWTSFSRSTEYFTRR